MLEDLSTEPRNYVRSGDDEQKYELFGVPTQFPIHCSCVAKTMGVLLVVFGVGLNIGVDIYFVLP